MTKILFIDNGIEFDSVLFREKALGGAEVAFVSLVEELAKLDLEVIVYNNCKNQGRVKNVEWRKLSEKVSKEKFDVLVTPTISDEAPLMSRVDQSISPGYFTRPFNYAGMCALSIQMGLSKIGLPLGLQVVARPNSEALAIQVGAAVERMTQPIF